MYVSKYPPFFRCLKKTFQAVTIIEIILHEGLPSKIPTFTFYQFHRAYFAKKKITLCAHTLRLLCFKFAWLEFYVVIKGKLVPVIELLSFYYLGLIRVVSHFGIWYRAVTHFHIIKFGIQRQDLWISFLSKLHVIATVVSY